MYVPEHKRQSVKFQSETSRIMLFQDIPSKKKNTMFLFYLLPLMKRYSIWIFETVHTTLHSVILFLFIYYDLDDN